MAKHVKIVWSKRPAALIEQGPEQSVIEWLDTGTIQAILTKDFEIVEKSESYTNLKKKHAQKKQGPKRSATSGPSKQEIANELVAANATKSRQELIQLVMETCHMSKAGAGTYVYNAQKALKA